MNIAEARIENHIDNLDMGLYMQLKIMCNDVADFLEAHFTPHTSVVITPYDFVVKEDIVNGFID